MVKFGDCGFDELEEVVEHNFMFIYVDLRRKSNINKRKLITQPSEEGNIYLAIN